jgi:hypothetical protein
MQLAQQQNKELKNNGLDWTPAPASSARGKSTTAHGLVLPKSVTAKLDRTPRRKSGGQKWSRSLPTRTYGGGGSNPPCECENRASIHGRPTYAGRDRCVASSSMCGRGCRAARSFSWPAITSLTPVLAPPSPTPSSALPSSPVPAPLLGPPPRRLRLTRRHHRAPSSPLSFVFLGYSVFPDAAIELRLPLSRHRAPSSLVTLSSPTTFVFSIEFHLPRRRTQWCI